MQVRDLKFFTPTPKFSTTAEQVTGLFDGKMVHRTTDRQWDRLPLIDLIDVEIPMPWKTLTRRGYSTAVAVVGSIAFAGGVGTYSEGLFRRPRPDDNAMVTLKSGEEALAAIRNASLARMAVLADRPHRQGENYIVQARGVASGALEDVHTGIPYIQSPVSGSAMPSQFPIYIAEAYQTEPLTQQPELVVADKPVSVISSAPTLPDAIAGFEQFVSSPYNVEGATLASIFGMGEADLGDCRQLITDIRDPRLAAKAILGLAG